MLKKYKYLVVGFAIILFVLPLVMGARLNDPRQNRDCYKNGLPFYVCVIEGTNIMEKSFLEYQEMHDFYTPQLKEIDLTGGSTQTMTPRKQMVTIQGLTAGELSYQYVKGN